MDLSTVKDVDSTSESSGCLCCETGYDSVLVQAKAEGEAETEDASTQSNPPVLERLGEEISDRLLVHT